MSAPSRSRRVIPAAIVIGVVVVFGVGLATGFLGNVATAERDFDVPPERLEKALRATAATMPRWTEVAPASSRDTTIHFEARTKVMTFVDDVRLDVSPREKGSHLRIHSKSREGLWDLGANGRRVRAFLAALDAQLAGQ